MKTGRSVAPGATTTNTLAYDSLILLLYAVAGSCSTQPHALEISELVVFHLRLRPLDRELCPQKAQFANQPEGPLMAECGRQTMTAHDPYRTVDRWQSRHSRAPNDRRSAAGARAPVVVTLVPIARAGISARRKMR